MLDSHPVDGMFGKVVRISGKGSGQVKYSEGELIEGLFPETKQFEFGENENFFRS